MTYQIVCEHVNYALGKTRMQVKKQKDTLIWIHVYINLLRILKSSCQQHPQYIPYHHCPSPPHDHKYSQYCYKTLIEKIKVSSFHMTYNLVIIFNMYPLFLLISLCFELIPHKTRQNKLVLSWNESNFFLLPQCNLKTKHVLLDMIILTGKIG